MPTDYDHIMNLIGDDAPGEARRFRLIHAGSSYALEDSVFATARDFARVEVERHDDDTLTNVVGTLKSVGVLSLHRMTAAHIDRHVAVQLGDSLLLVAVIVAPTGEFIPLAMGLAPSEAS